MRDAERGTLTLAASTTPGSYVLPSILECFAERHPRVDVDVVIGSSRWVAERVARREVSLGLAGEVDWPDGVLAEPFLEDEVIGIAAPGRLALRRGRATVEQLASQTLLVREPGSSTRAVAERRPRARVGLPARQALGARLQRGDQALGARRAGHRLRVAAGRRGGARARRARGLRGRRRRGDAALGLPAAPRRARARAGRARVHPDAVLLLRGRASPAAPSRRAA